MREDICSHDIAVTAMQSLASGVERDTDLPDAAWLWRKALLEQKQAETDRTVSVYGIAQCVAMSLVILAVSSLIGWCAMQLQDYLRADGQTNLWVRPSQVVWSIAAGSTHVSLESLSLVLLLAFAAFAAAHPLLAEE